MSVEPADQSDAIVDMTRADLARFAREYMIVGHVIDRTGLSQVAIRDGNAVEPIAIEEWMGASPVYTQRLQKTFGFEGDDVATIFKGFQLDCGLPHQFMDAGYSLDRETHGEFWLKSCGALLDIEPYGEKQIVSMCHHIEDPTFDASAAATNPRARITPIHRPPRQPADRQPHCHWQIDIDDANPPLTEVPATERVRDSLLARLAIVVPADEDAQGVARDRDGRAGGRHDYSGPFDPEFQLEHLSHAALVAFCRETAIAIHLLARSFLAAVTDRDGQDAATEIGAAQVSGLGWIVSERLGNALAADHGALDGLDGLARVLAVHPVFRPTDYTSLDLELTEGRLRVRLLDCPALHEGDHQSWIAILASGSDAATGAMNAIAQGFDRTSSAVLVDDPGAAAAWDITIAPDAAPADEPTAVALGKLSASAGFVLTTPVDITRRD